MFDFPGNITFFMGLVILVFGIIFVKENPIILFTILYAFIIGMISVHGDGMEVERHLQQASVALKLSFLILIIQLYSVIKNYSEKRVK